MKRHDNKMSWKVLFSIIIVCCCVHGYKYSGKSTSSPGPGDGPVTVTPSGTIRGSWMTSRRGRQIQAYRGIRYAEPPVGELRFQPPRPILQYTAEVDASEEGPACPQPTVDDYYIDEDCLKINVYTPAGRSGKKLLPVIFYMHSGGFYSVSGRSDVAGPLYLLDKDVVLVAINYRLASLGFISTGDKFAPGNNGFKDQVMALRWVQRNIRAFGGDPNLVTIAGCSAGSFSVMLHMISPMSKGLFHRAISISGSPVSQVEDRHDMKALAVKQAELVGCPSNSSQVIIDCLKTKTFRELGNSLDGFFVGWNLNEINLHIPHIGAEGAKTTKLTVIYLKEMSEAIKPAKVYERAMNVKEASELPGYDPVLVWSPVVELDFGQERFLTMKPVDAIRQGKMHAVPFIISQTHDEFFWKAFNVLGNQSILDSFNEEWARRASVAFLLPDGNSPEKAARLKEAYLDGKPLTNTTAVADGLGKAYADAVIGFGVHRMANLMCRHSPHKVWYYQFSYIGQRSHYEDPDTHKPVGAAHHDDLIYLFSLPFGFPVINATDSDDSRMVDTMTDIYSTFAVHGDPTVGNHISWPAMTPAARKYLRIDKQLSVQENLFEERFNVWEQLFPIQY